MKTILLSLVMASSTLAVAAEETALPTVYGSVVFGHGWEDMGDDAPYGIYALPPTQGDALSIVCRDNRLKADGGGVYVDGRYYMTDYSSYTDDGTVHFRAYDVADGWRLLYDHSLTTLSSIASDLAYDPVGDTIYGCFTDDEGSGSYFFGTLNRLTGQSTRIADLPQELMALAANRDGRLYAIGAYGMLFEVDKLTGALTEIGQTGKSIRYAQSATFDYATGRLLWAMTPHYTNLSAELCEVDPATGTTTTLTAIPNRYEFTGIYTESPYTPDGAPACPSQFAANFQKGSLSGTLTFALPATTFAGATLSGAVGYELKLDGATVATASAAAGTTASVPQTLTRGMHYLRLAASNSTGRSPFVHLDFWAGMDYAAALSPTATLAANGDVSIRWQAPTQGTHGGYIDTQKLTFKVVRMPDGKTLYEGTGTSCTDAATTQLEYDNYHYDVIALVGGEAGDTVSTSTLTLGKAVSLPYVQLFNTEDAAATMTVEDANGDGSTWTYWYGMMVYSLSEATLDADDWLMTPALTLSGDSIYRVSVDVSADEGYSERLAIMAGATATAADMTQTVLPVTEVSNVESQPLVATFRPQTSGACHIGLHALSTYADGSNFYIDNLRVETLASIHAPAAVTGAKAVAEGAERKVNIAFTAPATDLEGKTLTQLDRIDVVRTTDGATVATLTTVSPGQACQLTDLPTADGMTAYTITPCNSHGTGMPSQLQVYVGYDQPSGVTGAKVEATDDGRVTATWQAPTVGQHGGAVDVANLKYTVSNLKGDASSKTTVSQTSYSETLTLTEGVQQLAWYVITPQNQQGQGDAVSTDTVFVGSPYAMPYAESFASRSLDHGPWYTNNTDVAEWNLMQFGTYANASDDDNGLISFSTLVEGAQARMVGPKVTLKGSANPHLRLFAWNMENNTHSARIMLRLPDGTLQQLDDFAPNDCDYGENVGEWKRRDYDLSAYKALDYVQPVFIGVGGKAADLAAIRPMYLDQVSIIDLLSQDLAIGTLTTETDHVSVGETVKFLVGVQNKGAQSSDGFTVRLLRDGNEVAHADVKALEADGEITLTLRDTPNSDAAETSRYTAQIDYAADADATNNTSATCVVTVLPGRPYINNVKAEAAESTSAVTLTWQEPQGIQTGTQAETVTEGFETYPAFTISHFGQWTLYDGDLQTTMGIQDGHGNFVQYDNVEAPMAFQVFCPSAVNLSSFYYPVHTGKQVAAAFNAGRYTANDDWLISPEVDGAQTISFYACSPDASYYGTNEQLEVLCSTTDTEPGSFTKIGQTITVPGQWTQYTAALPDGARYFALRCTSMDQYILFLDDITYRRAARDFHLTGYNVYCDGSLLATLPSSQTSYTDPQGSQQRKYEVSAVYNTGESRLTAATWDGASAIGTTAIGTDDNAPAAVYDLQGRRLPATQPLGPGIYIVRQGNTTRKISVK